MWQWIHSSSSSWSICSSLCSNSRCFKGTTSTNMHKFSYKTRFIWTKMEVLKDKLWFMNPIWAQTTLFSQLKTEYFAVEFSFNQQPIFYIILTTYIKTLQEYTQNNLLDISTYNNESKLWLPIRHLSQGDIILYLWFLSNSNRSINNIHMPTTLHFLNDRVSLWQNSSSMMCHI